MQNTGESLRARNIIYRHNERNATMTRPPNEGNKVKLLLQVLYDLDDAKDNDAGLKGPVFQSINSRYAIG